MFNMPRNAGANDGYQLRITYDAATQLYVVAGYIIFKVEGNKQYDLDGEPLNFTSLEAVIESITNYPDKGK